MTWEIAVVKTTDYGTRLKVCDGTSAYKSLDSVGNATNHLMDTCVCCGAVVPEGRMVCWACENGKGVSPERTNDMKETMNPLYAVLATGAAGEAAGGTIVLDEPATVDVLVFLEANATKIS